MDPMKFPDSNLWPSYFSVLWTRTKRGPTFTDTCLRYVGWCFCVDLVEAYRAPAAHKSKYFHEYYWTSLYSLS